jgi:hypothetical protein
MKRFNDLSIRVRLTIVFCCMSAFAIAIGLFGLLMEQSGAKTIVMIFLVLFAASASTGLGKIISNSIYLQAHPQADWMVRKPCTRRYEY